MLPSIFNNNLFDDFFGFPFYYDNRAEDKAEKKLYGHHAGNLMKTDIKELDNGYELEIDLPGYKKDEIKAELNNGYLTVSAAESLDEDMKTRRQAVHQTMLCRRMPEKYYVGEDITEEDIKASFEHGILTLFWYLRKKQNLL